MSILQDKIEELETLLGNLFTSPPAESPCHPLHADDVEQRLLFLKNLLAAESTSKSKSNPTGLQRIDRRLTELEAAFRAWDGIRLMKTTSFRSMPLDDDVSTCSGDSGSEVVGLVDDDYGKEEVLAEEVSSSGVDEEMEARPKRRRPEEVMRKKKIRGGGRSRRYLEGVGCGVVVGAIVMALGMLHFHSCLYPYSPFGPFPFPT